MPVITSSKNPSVRRVGKLRDPKERKATGLVLIEGPNLVGAARMHGLAFETVVATEDDHEASQLAASVDAELLVVTDRVLAAIADAKHPRSPIAVVRRPPSAAVEVRDTVVLVDVADPGNAGTIVRSAAAFGFAVVSTPGTVDLWSPKVLRAGAGAHFVTPITIGLDLDALPSELATAATTVVGGSPAAAVAGPIAVLVGNEAHGLHADVVAAAEFRVTIPIVGKVESLNAAVAASIVMHGIRQASAGSS